MTSESDNPANSRYAALLAWLAEFDDTDAGRVELASADASFRRYFRVFTQQGSVIAMDAPPDCEDSAPFVRVAGYLADAGLNAPRVLAADLAQGFLLLTDLGRREYLHVLVNEAGSREQLYNDAVIALDVMQTACVSVQGQLPAYDRALLGRELALFRDWLCVRHLGLTLTDDDERAWHACCEALIDCALAQPRVFVHRDWHSRNLMVCPGDNPGILDFQDAVEGPYTYDLVSMLKDCYLRLPSAEVDTLAQSFYARRRAALPASMTPHCFRRDFELMGVQRHLKAAGIFARLKHRDGKPGYMANVPRTLGYIVDIAPRHPELEVLGRFLVERCLPAMESGA